MKRISFPKTLLLLAAFCMNFIAANANNNTPELKENRQEQRLNKLRASAQNLEVTHIELGEAWLPRNPNRIKAVHFGAYQIAVHSIIADEQSLLQGTGQLYLDFVGQMVNVAFSDVKIDRDRNLLEGFVYLQESPMVTDLLDENGQLYLSKETVGNQYLDLAKDHGSLPLALNSLLSSAQENSLNKHHLLITDLLISANGMTVDYGLMSPAVNGGYFVFEQKNLTVNDPMALCDLEMFFVLPADPPAQNYELPLEIKDVSTVDANKKSKANFNCGGLEDFYLVGEYTFPLDKAKPTDGNLKNAMAYFEVTSKEIEQFIADCIVTGYRIPGAEAFYFTPTFARLDYSDSANPNGFPADHPRQVDDTWKGIYLHSKLAFPKGFKNNDGSDLEIEIKNFVYDHGDGFSGREKQTDLLPLETSRVYGWPLSMDLLDLEVKYSSFVKLDIEGEVRLPITNSSNGFPYSLRLNPQGTDLNKNTSIAGLFQLKDKSAFEKSFEIPYLQGSSMALQTSSNIKLLSINDELQPQADLNGVMGAIVDGHNIPMTFEHLMINNRKHPGMENLAAGTITAGLDRITVDAVKWSVANNALQSVLNKGPNAGTYSAWDWLKPKLSYFPIKVESMSFRMEEIDGKTYLSMNTEINVNFTIAGKGLKGGCEFEVIGDVNLAALNTPNYWDALKYKETMLGLMWVDVDLVIFSIKGGVRFFRKDATYGDGWKGAINVTISKGFPVQLVALLQYGKAPGGAYNYMFFDAILSMDTKEEFYKEDKKTGNYTKISGLKQPLLKKTLHYKAKKERYWGDTGGVKAAREAVSISVDNGKGTLKPTDAFGQQVSLGGSNNQQNLKNKMRYTIEPGKLALYGGGIGFFYNMSRAPAPNNFNPNGQFVTDVPMNVNDPLDLLQPGKTLSGARYMPRNNTVGFKLTVVLGSDPKPHIYNGDFSISIEFDTKDFSLRRITLDGVAYVLTPLHDRSDAQAYLQATVDFDWENRVFNLEAHAYVMLHIPKKIAGGISASTMGFLQTPYISKPLIYGRNPDHRAGSAGIKIRLNEWNRWMVYVGTAQQPLGFKTRLIDGLDLGGYFMTGRVEMMGWQAEPRSLKDVHPALAKYDNSYAMSRGSGEIASGSVWLTGAFISLPRFNREFLSRLRVSISAAAGYDIGIMSAVCKNGTSIGVGGKYARGRIYGHLDIRGQLDPPGPPGWTTVGSVTLNVNLAGRTPNPTYVAGHVSGEFCLGPFCKSFSKNVDAEFGSGCGDDIKTQSNLDQLDQLENLDRPIPLNENSDWAYAINDPMGDLSLSSFATEIDEQPAKEMLMNQPLILNTLPAKGQIYGVGDLYMEVSFRQTMQQRLTTFPDLQPVIDYVSLTDENGQNIGYDLRYLRDTETRPGAETGFDIVRIYPDQNADVNKLRLAIKTGWLQEIDGNWEVAKTITESTFGEFYKDEFEVEKVKFALFEEDFDELVPAWKDRYFYRTQTPKLVLNNELALAAVGEEAMVKISAINSSQKWEYPVETIDPNTMEITIGSFENELELGEFYKMEIIQKGGEVIFENVFRTSMYASFAEKLQDATLSYETTDVGNDLARTFDDGEDYNFYTPAEMNSQYNEVRFKLNSEEGFGEAEIALYLPDMKADASSGYFQAMQQFYTTKFGGLANAEQDLYSDLIGRNLSATEIQNWFSFDETNQFTFIPTTELGRTGLTEREINKGEMMEEPVALLLECDAVKKAQFRYQMAQSLYNPQNRSVLEGQSNTAWRTIQDLQIQYNNCLYGGNCDLNDEIPWYGDQTIQIKVGDNSFQLDASGSSAKGNF